MSFDHITLTFCLETKPKPTNGRHCGSNPRPDSTWLRFYHTNYGHNNASSLTVRLCLFLTRPCVSRLLAVPIGHFSFLYRKQTFWHSYNRWGNRRISRQRNAFPTYFPHDLFIFLKDFPALCCDFFSASDIVADLAARSRE